MFHKSKIALLLLVLLSGCGGSSDNNNNSWPEYTGSSNIELLADFNMEAVYELDLTTGEFGEAKSRDIKVYLPPDYYTSNNSYPVIYMQDGQWLFESGEDGEEWQVDELLDSLFNAQSNQGIIVVAVDNDGFINRLFEYSSWQNQLLLQNGNPFYMGALALTTGLPVQQLIDSQAPLGGQGEQYTQFLTTVLKPYIDDNYRTLTDKANTSIGGASMGGFFALYSALRNPEIFGNVIALSPAVWFSIEGLDSQNIEDADFFNYMDENLPDSDLRVFLSVGAQEDHPQFELPFSEWYPDGVDLTYNKLIELGLPEEQLKKEFFPTADEGHSNMHDGYYWKQRFPEAIDWLF